MTLPRISARRRRIWTELPPSPTPTALPSSSPAFSQNGGPEGHVTTAIHDAANERSVISISHGWPGNDTTNGLTRRLRLSELSTQLSRKPHRWVSLFLSRPATTAGCGAGDGKAYVLYPDSDPLVTCCDGALRTPRRHGSCPEPLNRLEALLSPRDVRAKTEEELPVRFQIPPETPACARKEKAMTASAWLAGHGILLQ
jgi:hypothetical protein